VSPLPGWDPAFARRSKLFDAVAHVASGLSGLPEFPSVATMARLLAACDARNAHGLPVVPYETGSSERYGAARYELDVARYGRLRVRAGTWHDLFNVLAWCALPATKAALNRIHTDDIASGGISGGDLAPQARGGRGRRRDAATLLDENGALVAVADDEAADLIRTMRWTELFVGQRASVAGRVRLWAIGHGLLEKALSPYVGLTAHALLLRVDPDVLALPAGEFAREADARAGAVLAHTPADFGPRVLHPFPVLGMPGFWPPNQDPDFYRNTAYFRTGRGSR
jgi:Protein of unknown function (DUF3025)